MRCSISESIRRSRRCVRLDSGICSRDLEELTPARAGHWKSMKLRIEASKRGEQWIARAHDEDAGRPFGIECAGATERDAVDRLTRWVEWQREHAAALEALQTAERAYHRTIAGSAFASPSEGPSAIELQKESLDLVEAARVRLDEIRARKPD